MQVNGKIAQGVLSLVLAASCHLVQAKPLHEKYDKRSRSVGLASYYSDRFHGRRTASGERYNRDALTAVHNSFPFGTLLRVTNLRNQRSVLVRVNDRSSHRHGRLLDLSKRAARELGFIGAGLALVKLEVIELGAG
ncbi:MULTISPECIES: septal ring lytic transglycosylase RlpA family protein [Methylococcus]|uniref:Endolytic peptidoglycan transglycosylase RlpA n=1 Tax=Methylococcus capsulatus TaxID=414 RepID=A0ABZ2F6B5_METCP|nr:MULTISPECIES: septal ring lytic transglycosylase RlpA family protein [Methylococcus]MDF9393696.1 septal ring lytic transglycosylase RlpA family protein [Methylococcus capsulatus]